jgi:hypothetical protein
MRKILLIAVIGAALGCSSTEAEDAEDASQAGETTEGSEEALTAASGVDDPFEVHPGKDRVLWGTDEGVFSLEKRSGRSWWSSATPTRVVKGKLGDGARFGPTFAVDASDDAVFAIADGKLVKASASGGATMTYSFALPEVGGVVVDASHVYLSAKDGVYRAPKDFSAAPTKHASVSCAGSFDSSMRELASDPNAVFLVACGDRLLRIEKTNGAVSTLVNEQVSSIAVDGGKLYILAGGELRSMPASGGAATVLLSDDDVHSVAASGNSILLSSITKVVRFDLTTKQTRTLATHGGVFGFPPLAVQRGSLKDLAIDGTEYWYALGNTRPVTGPWPDDDTPKTGKIGYERIR